MELKNKILLYGGVYVLGFISGVGVASVIFIILGSI